MAPISSAPKPTKPGAGKKPRPIVPAIPLPHVKRQAAIKAAAAAAKAKSAPESETTTPNGTTAVETKIDSPAASTVTLDSTNETNKADSIATSSPANVKHEEPAQIQELSNSTEEPHAIGPSHEVAIDSHEPSHGLSDNNQAGAPVDAVDGGVKAEQTPSMESALTSEPAEDHAPQAQHDAALHHHVPPPFMPPQSLANALSNVPQFHEPVPAGPNGFMHGHSARPSHGNIHFGTFDDSAGNSPAPPLSGGIAPPPALPLGASRPQHNPHISNEFQPAMDPIGANMFDQYGRPVGDPAFPAQQQYRSYMPSVTPPNFQDHQPMGYPGAGVGAAYDSFAGPAPREMAHPASRNERNIPNAPMTYPDPAHQNASPSAVLFKDDATDMITYFQRQFGDQEYTDCTLDVQFLDRRLPGFKFAGHRLVLSRSPVLQALLRNKAHHPSSAFVLQSDDDHVRTGAFYQAIQRLYGLPLLDIPPPSYTTNGEGTTSAGSTTDRFNFALSYAAAGHLIGWNPVVQRGCEIAARFLSAVTIESAMRFSMKQYRDFGTHEDFKYGPGSRIILDGVLNFIVDNVGSNFVLDASVANPNGYTRLPYDTPSAEQSASSPVSVHGTHRGHASHGSRSQGHLNIRFGDLSVADGSSEEANASSASNLRIVLSRVLINLPFVHLKMLESAPMHLLPVLQTVVAEREARRLRALETLRSGRMPNSDPVLRNLSSLQPPQADPWTILGWQEEIAYNQRADGPSIRRQWVPLKQSAQASVVAYP